MNIVDADHYTYRAAASCSPTKTKTFLEPVETALHRFDDMMHQLIIAQGEEMELYMGGEGNWRFALYPEYKANRKDKPRPVWLEDVREYAAGKWKVQIVNEREADDMCGIRMTELQAQGLSPVCTSLDKDLKTVPGRHFNFVKDVEEIVSPVQALRYFYKQLVTGDQSDNIPAFDGLFRNTVPKFVQLLLNPIDTMISEDEMYDYVKSVYIESGGELETMHRNASVLHIQTTYESRWQPPGQPVV